jgi:ribosomal protein S18 acetylase RimI-like enzyme
MTIMIQRTLINNNIKIFKNSLKYYIYRNISTRCDISIRNALISDIPAISSINRRTLPENYEHYVFQSHISQWPHLSYVAENIDKNIVGYILGVIEEEDSSTTHNNGFVRHKESKTVRIGHIFSIAVEASFRGGGVGEMLLSRVHKEMLSVAPPLSLVYLLCRPSNKTAISFYTNKYNYKLAAVMNQYYIDGEDAWRMEYNLSSISHTHL